MVNAPFVSGALISVHQLFLQQPLASRVATIMTSTIIAPPMVNASITIIYLFHGLAINYIR